MCAHRTVREGVMPNDEGGTTPPVRAVQPFIRNCGNSYRVVFNEQVVCRAEWIWRRGRIYTTDFVYESATSRAIQGVMVYNPVTQTQPGVVRTYHSVRTTQARPSVVVHTNLFHNSIGWLGIAKPDGII